MSRLSAILNFAPFLMMELASVEKREIGVKAQTNNVTIYKRPHFVKTSLSFLLYFYSQKINNIKSYSILMEAN